MDIVYDKKNVIISAKTGVSKSLKYQAIYLINLKAIILIIILIIVLIKD